MENKQNPRIYRLVPSEQLERLIKTNFLLSKGLLLFEYVQSKRRAALPDGRAACEVLEHSPRDADPLPSETVDSSQDLSAAIPVQRLRSADARLPDQSAQSAKCTAAYSPDCGWSG